jgi:Cdc6-like AAA superfamily ATPase
MKGDTFKKMELQFILGEDEQALVNKSSSMFILGRSGTGKTTVMLAKMLLLEEVSKRSEVKKFTGKKVTQWLVTCNNVLKNASEQYYLKLRLSCPELESSKLSEFFSFRDLLLKIDGALETSFLLQGPEASSALSDYVNYDTCHSYAGKIGSNRLENEVTFLRFASTYYPRFTESVRKSFSASIIWTEIQVV